MQEIGLGERSRGVEHSEYLNQRPLEAIDDSIRAPNDFTAVVPADFRHDATGPRELLETLGGCDDPFDRRHRVMDGVPRDVVPDGFDVLDCLNCPDEANHLMRRVRAASCGRVSPASA